MALLSMHQETLNGLHDAVVGYRHADVVQLSEKAIKEGMAPMDVITQGLSKGMETVGRLYDECEYFIPELVNCADAMNAGLEILKPHLNRKDEDRRLKVIIGSVEGDIHEIGRKLVRIMYEAAGWCVYDLGMDVAVERFLHEQEKVDPDVVCLSALMTTSMHEMPRFIEKIKSKNPSVAVMVGGAPMTKEIAQRYGADGYAEHCGKAVQKTLEAVSKTKNAGFAGD